MQVIFHKRFKKRYKKLSTVEQQAFDTCYRLFVSAPFDHALRNHALRGKYEGFRSIDIAHDLRALYEVVDEHTVQFVYLGTHSELYG